MKRKRKKRAPSLITGHLGGIKRALLDGEKRPAFLEFLNQRETSARRGIYALYDKRGGLYYTGKASDLPKRLNHHLKDKHGESWEAMTLFFVGDSANVGELEGLVVAAAKPPGNKQKPKVGQDLRKSLSRFLRQDAVQQINQVVYPERQQKRDPLSQRITMKKLKTVSQMQLGQAIGISQGFVSHLIKKGKIRQYILQSGKRDRVLLLLSK